MAQKRYKLVVSDVYDGGSSAKTPNKISKEACIINRKEEVKSKIKQLLNYIQDTTKGKRNPSHCDRILYISRGVKTNNKCTTISNLPSSYPDSNTSSNIINIKQVEYNSFANDNIITQSDHDMVYSKYKLQINNDAYNILFITWNQANKKIKFTESNYNNWNTIMDLKSQHVIILSQQESDSKDVMQETFIQVMEPKGFSSYATSTGVLGFHIRLTVLIKPNTGLTLLDKRSECTSKLLCTKAISGISFVKKINSDKCKLMINFYGAHFPINTKKEDLGLSERKKALEQYASMVTKFHKNKKEVANIIHTIDIIGGDLNFRIVNNKDQLTEIIKNKSIPELTELEPTFPPTCKKTPCE